MTTALEPIKKYARMARAVDHPFPRVSREVAKLMTIRDDLFGVESATRDTVNERIAVLQGQAKIELPYPRLSIEPLKWVKNGKPVFAMFALGKPVMRITKSYYNGTRVIPHLPDPIHTIYTNAPVIVDFAADPYRNFTLSARFAGMIPAPVRTEIKKAEPMFGEGMMFLVAEADWKARSVTIDPLVVGWDGKSLRLITMFDLTTLEKELVG